MPQFAGALALFLVLVVFARAQHLGHLDEEVQAHHECAMKVPVGEVTAEVEAASEALLATLFEPVLTTEAGRDKMTRIAAIATAAAADFDKLEKAHCEGH